MALRREFSRAAQVLALIMLASFATAVDPVTMDLDGKPQSPRVFTIDGDDAIDLLGSGDHSGIAFGDLDGDGFDEFIVGTYRSDGMNNDLDNAGEVDIAWGGPQLRGQHLDLNTNSVITGAHETRIYGDDPLDYLGRAVACGDLDGDGYEDLAIGAFGSHGIANDPNATGTGEVIIIWGGPKLRGKRYNLDTNGVIGSWGESRIFGDGLGDSTGFAIAFGDIDADGTKDLIFSAIGGRPYEGKVLTGSRTEESAGRIYIVYGSPDLRGKRIDLHTNGPVSALGETRIYGELAETPDLTLDSLGVSIGIGDFDGDGFDDILTSSPRKAPGCRFDAGACYVIHGGPNLRGKEVFLDPRHPSANRDVVRILGRDPEDRFGHTVAAGDVDGDGLADALCVAVLADGPDNDRPESGESHLFFGDGLKRGMTIDLAAPDTIPESQFVTFGAEKNSVVSLSSSIGDVNGDGLGDVFLGSVSNDGPQHDTDDGGAVFGFLGSPTLRGQVRDLATTTPDLWYYATDQQIALGYGIDACGDVDDDGVGDVGGAAIYAYNPTIDRMGNEAGRAYLIFGEASSDTARETRFQRAGDAPPCEFGPSLRVTINYSDGDGPSDTQVTRTGNVWQFSSARKFTTATITLRYVAGEFTPDQEQKLRIYRASSADGPWEEVEGQTRNLHRRELVVAVRELGWFRAATSRGELLR